MRNLTTKPTIIFWIISIVALLWNAIGIKAYLFQAYLTDEILSTLPTEDQAYYNNVPAWVTAAFAIAVFAGTLGCLLLLFRKSWAKPLFILSFLAVIIQSIYTFFIQDYIEITGTNSIMPVIVIVIAAFLVWFSKKSERKGWIF